MDLMESPYTGGERWHERAVREGLRAIDRDIREHIVCWGLMINLITLRDFDFVL